MSEIVESRTINRRITWLLLIANLSVPAWVLLQRNDTNLSDTATTWVGWISAAFVTALVLASTYLRRPADSRKLPRRMVWTSIGFVILSGIITTISISSNPSDSYLQVALSDSPLSKIHPERKRIVVELIRRDKAASDENSRFARSMRPISPALYSVDSLASKTAMESTIAQFKQASDNDTAYVAAKSNALKNFHDQMAKVDPVYLQAFEADLQKKNAVEDALEATETKWVTSTLNLYNYAIAHADQISMNKTGHLVIADEGVRQSILQQLDACRTLQNAASGQREKAVDDQHARQDAEGIKHTD
jgi:hypothetical protein